MHASNPELGTILGVWGHPDDEAYLSAGIMAAAVDHGDRVVCVTATRGEAGFPDDDARSERERKAVHEAELDACLDVLGVADHRWLDYADGGCDLVEPVEAASRIAAVIDEVRPDTILTFGPDGMTGHVDHIAASSWTTEAFKRTGSKGRLLYATKSSRWARQFVDAVTLEAVMMRDDVSIPGVEIEDLALHVELDGAANERKLRALRCQASQVAPLRSLVGEEAYERLNREEFFRLPTQAELGA